MSRTIELPISVYNRNDSVARIDVEAVAAFAVEVRNGQNRYFIDAKWRQAGLFDYADDGSGEIVITPRCEDLIASLPHLPDDPAPVESSRPSCSACNGSGEQALFVSMHVCDRCHGSKLEPVRVIDSSLLCAPFRPLGTPSSFEPCFFGGELLPRRANEPASHSSGNDWTLIDSEDVAQRFVGKLVEIDAPWGAGTNQHSQHGECLRVIKAENGELWFAPEVCIYWQGRGNVRLRVVDEG